MIKVKRKHDPMNCSTPGLPVHHQLPEFTQTQSIESMMHGMAMPKFKGEDETEEQLFFVGIERC